MKPSALLLDLDGTIYQGESLIPGSLELLEYLNEYSIPYRFLTNTTRMAKKKLVIMFRGMGLKLLTNDIFSPPYAAAMYCQSKGYNNIKLMVQDKDIYEDFSAFRLVNNNPEAIVLGDMGNKFTFNLINNLFNHILDGAELVAMHKNRYWKSSNGYTLDVGAFVSALEYASGKSASIMGKPNANFFSLASQGWNLPAEKIIMVGDDIDSDIGGALNAGMKSVLVKTGKFREKNLKCSNIKPHYIIDSIADLRNILTMD